MDSFLMPEFRIEHVHITLYIMYIMIERVYKITTTTLIIQGIYVYCIMFDIHYTTLNNNNGSS